VTQEVLLRLADKLRTFVYDPARSFRAWLKTVTHHVWHDLTTGSRLVRLGSGDSSVLDLLHQAEARDDLVARLNQGFDLELLDEAMARVRLWVEAGTWEAFRLTALEGQSGAAAAEQLGVAVAAVFKAKSNVQKMLQHELARLEKDAS
jgi:RNA polymerase sigma-70 factor (ECF subfamily)